MFVADLGKMLRIVLLIVLLATNELRERLCRTERRKEFFTSEFHREV